MLNEKQRRLSLMFGLGAFVVLMCLCAGFNSTETPTDPPAALAWVTLVLLCTVAINTAAWFATLAVFTKSGSQSVAFIASGAALMLFMVVMARTEPGIQILFAFLAGRHAIIMLCSYLEERRTTASIPPARLVT